MELHEKLAILADAAKYDASCASSGVKRKGGGPGIGSTTGMGICHSYTPDGRCISLLKVLLTNACIYDCRYCVNRVSSDIPRARFTPEEVVTLTLEFYRRNYIEGLFLSSGVLKNPDSTMEEVIRVARTLRQVHRFNGYIHLKAAPGASDALLVEAGRWADRLSVNVELPTQQDLDELAPEKTLQAIESTMGTIRLRLDEAKEAKAFRAQAPRFAPAGQSTQMIVGATPSPDRTLLETSAGLYGKHRLKRVYYSAFSPIPKADPRLPLAAPPLVREHRLYQADWLMRFYGFRHGELTTPEQPNLDLELDPKLGWALRHPGRFPVDLQTAPRELLLRVPGLGQRTVERLLRIRRWHRVRLADLVKLRVPLDKAQPFVVTADHNPDTRLLDQVGLKSILQKRKPQQLGLFEPEASALGGEL